ncbi:MAG: amino acid permease [Alphaproteobacteria bacterium]
MAKKLGFWTLLSLVMGNMIGGGIFMLPASLAAYGSLSLIGWGVTTVGALFLALVFARLSYRFPIDGGPYAYCRAALGNFMGFQVAWIYWISMWVGSAATVTATVSYISVFFPELTTNPLLSLAASTTIIWGLTLLNIFSLKASSVVQVLTTILKILPLILLVVFGLPRISIANFQPFNPSGEPFFSALLSASIITMWTFIGIESATVPAKKVHNPAHTIPRATLWGTGLVAVFYIILSIFMIGVIPNAELKVSTAPFAMAASVIWGPWGSSLIALIVIIASLGCLNGWVLIEAQVPASAAQDGLFPKKFAQTNKDGLPVFSMIFTACLTNSLVLLNYHKNFVAAFSFMIILATVAVLITYLFSVISEVVLILKEKKKLSKIILVKNFLVVVLASSYIVLALVGAGAEILLWGILLFCLSIPFYFYKRS